MNINKYEFKNKIINLENVPSLSGASIQFLKNTSSDYKFVLLRDLQIDSAARQLKKLSDDLEFRKNHPIKKVVYSISYSLMTTAVFAAGLFGVLHTSLPILCGIAAATLYCSLGIISLKSEPTFTHANIWEYALFALGGGIGLPLFDLIFNKRSHSFTFDSLKSQIDYQLTFRAKAFKSDYFKLIEKIDLDSNIGKEFDSNVQFYYKL